MKYISKQLGGGRPKSISQSLKSRAFRSIAVLLGLLLLANTPAYAGPVTIGDVIQVISNYKNPPSLRLHGISQTSSTPVVASVTTSTSGVDTISSSAISPASTSLLAGITLDTQDLQKTVTIVAPGDIEGTICDCGEITVGAGFPKWPLLFLAAIPFFFIDDDDVCENCDDIVINPTPTPTPTPTPQTPVPEPASLLLFGSGLAAVGASLRRRRMKAKLKMQGESTEEG